MSFLLLGNFRENGMPSGESWGGKSMNEIDKMS